MSCLFACCVQGAEEPLQRQVLSSKGPVTTDPSTAENSTTAGPPPVQELEAGRTLSEEQHGQTVSEEVQQPALECTCRPAVGQCPDDDDLRAIVVTPRVQQQAIIAAYHLERRARVEPKLLQLLRAWAVQLLVSLTQLLSAPVEQGSTQQQHQHGQKVLCDFIVLLVSNGVGDAEEGPCPACKAQMAALHTVAVTELVKALKQEAASTSLQLSCLRCLFKLLRQQEGAAAAVKCNAHEPLIRLLQQTSQPLLIRASLVCVYYLGADDTSLQELLVTNGVVPPLLRLVQDAVDDMLQEAVQVVKMLCKSAVCCEALEAAGMRPLLQIVAAASPDAATVAQAQIALARLTDAANQLPAQESPKGQPNMSFSHIRGLGSSGHWASDPAGSLRRATSRLSTVATTCHGDVVTSSNTNPSASSPPGTAQSTMSSDPHASEERSEACAGNGQSCSSQSESTVPAGSRFVTTVASSLEATPVASDKVAAAVDSMVNIAAKAMQEKDESAAADNLPTMPHAPSASTQVCTADAAAPGSAVKGHKCLISHASGGSMLETAGSGLISIHALMQVGGSSHTPSPTNSPTAAWASADGHAGLYSARTSIASSMRQSLDCETLRAEAIRTDSMQASANASSVKDLHTTLTYTPVTGIAGTAAVPAAVQPSSSSTSNHSSAMLPVVDAAALVPLTVPPLVTQQSSCTDMADALSGPLLLDVVQLTVAQDYGRSMKLDSAWCADSCTLLTEHMTQYFTAPGSPATVSGPASPSTGVETLTPSAGARTISRETSAGQLLGARASQDDDVGDVLASWLPLPPRPSCRRSITTYSVQHSPVDTMEFGELAMKTSRSESAACDASLTAEKSCMADMAVQTTVKDMAQDIQAVTPSKAERQQHADSVADTSSPFYKHQLSPATASRNTAAQQRGGRLAASWARHLRVDVSMAGSTAADCAVGTAMALHEPTGMLACMPSHTAPTRLTEQSVHHLHTTAADGGCGAMARPHQDHSSHAPRMAADISTHMISISSMSDASATASHAVASEEELMQQQLMQSASLACEQTAGKPSSQTSFTALPTPCYHQAEPCSHSALATPVTSPTQYQLSQPVQSSRNQQQCLAPAQLAHQQDHDWVAGTTLSPGSAPAAQHASAGMPGGRHASSIDSWSLNNSDRSVKNAALPAYMRPTAASAARAHACNTHNDGSCKLPTTGIHSPRSGLHATPRACLQSTGSEPIRPVHMSSPPHSASSSSNNNCFGSNSSADGNSPLSRHSGPVMHGRYARHFAATSSPHHLTIASMPSRPDSLQQASARSLDSKGSPAPPSRAAQSMASLKHVTQGTAIKDVYAAPAQQHLSPRLRPAIHSLPCSKFTRPRPSSNATCSSVVKSGTPSPTVLPIYPARAFCTSKAVPTAVCHPRAGAPTPLISSSPDQGHVIQCFPMKTAQSFPASQQTKECVRTPEPCQFSPAPVMLGTACADTQQQDQQGSIGLQYQRASQLDNGSASRVAVEPRNTQGTIDKDSDPSHECKQQLNQMCPATNQQAAPQQGEVDECDHQLPSCISSHAVKMEHSGELPQPLQCKPDDDKQLPETADCKLDMCEDGNRPHLLGEGGSSCVHQGMLRGVIPVAVKVAKKKFPSNVALHAFLDEAQLLRRLDHRNILQAYGVCLGGVMGSEKLSTCVTLVTELMCGGDMYHALQNQPELMKWEGLGHQVALDIAAGLDYLHCQTPPIMHRDLKSTNILLTEEGVAKIADVGLSKSYQADHVTAKSTVISVWAAPEVLDKQPYSVKCDMWSYGLLVWELATGLDIIKYQPLALLGQGEVTSLHMPDNAPAVARRIFKACTQMDPEARPTAAQCMTWLLEASTH